MLEGVHNMAPAALSHLEDAMRDEPAPFQLSVAHDQWQPQLTGLGCYTTLGVKVKPSAWMSFHTSFSEFLDKHMITVGDAAREDERQVGAHQVRRGSVRLSHG